MCNFDKRVCACGHAEIVKVNSECNGQRLGNGCQGEIVDKWEPASGSECGACAYARTMRAHHSTQYVVSEIKRLQEEEKSDREKRDREKNDGGAK